VPKHRKARVSKMMRGDEDVRSDGIYDDATMVRRDFTTDHE
jgi:hypothetical protein